MTGRNDPCTCGSGKKYKRCCGWVPTSERDKARFAALLGQPKTPEPGLNGDYRDACVVCLRGTDSGLAFRGVAEFVIAGLAVLGIPRPQAVATFEAYTGCPPGIVPGGEVTVGVRLCRPCAEASGTAMQVGLIPNLLLYAYGGDEAFNEDAVGKEPS